jgi:hypothetical protein
MTDKPKGDLGWLEPESPANDETAPEYPFDNIILTESGHSFELDDTPERERIRLQHRTGTFVEMHPNGDEVHNIVGDGYEIVSKNKEVLIKGVCSVTVEGDCVFHVLGDRIDRVDGDYKLDVKGKVAMIATKDFDVSSRRDLNLQAGYGLGQGYINMTTPQNITFDGDLYVGGSITADIITALTRVDAGFGVSAGPGGFVTLEGGISVGTLVPIPGTINCIGWVLAQFAVFSNLGKFNVMSSNFMTDRLNTGLYNLHIHPTPKGPSGLPTTFMV